MDLEEKNVSDSEGCSKSLTANRGLVRDMIRKYDAINIGSAKTSYSSIISAMSSSSGDDIASLDQEDNIAPLIDDEFKAQDEPYDVTADDVKESNESNEMQDEALVTALEAQKSFLDLSSQIEEAVGKPKPKKSVKDTHINIADTSYQSKTTIIKTSNGVRIIIDIFFGDKKNPSIEDVVGSRIETDIPPSKILSDFQKRVAKAEQNY